MSSDNNQSILEQYDRELLEWKNTETERELNKRETIKRWAVMLEQAGFDQDKISTKLKKDLAGFASESYIKATLESKYKDKSKVRNAPEKIAVTAGAGTTETVTTTETSSGNNAREEYEKNKYTKLAQQAGKSVGKTNSTLTVSEANRQIESNDRLDQVEKENLQLRNQISKMKDEIIQHTTISLSKDKFKEVSKFIDDPKIKRVLFDFDPDSMNVTRIRATI